MKGGEQTPYQLLVLEIPKTNEKKELAAEALFAALHGIYRPKIGFLSRTPIQDQISFEIASIGRRIRFYVHVPEHLKSFVVGQIYAQYPTVQIKEQTEDYADRPMAQPVIHTTELTLIDNETLPIKTFQSFEVDPLAAITATLSKLDDTDEEMWIQFIIRPISDDWHKRSSLMVKRIKESGGGLKASGLLGALVKPPEYGNASTDLSERDKSRVTAIQEKSTKLGYQVKIRVLYAGANEGTARLRMQAMVSTFKQFNTTNLNGFQSKFPSFSRERVEIYQSRKFTDRGFILNIEELASLYHLPHTNVETPNIVWATSKTAEPPANLPVEGTIRAEDISLFGITNFRGDNQVFGALRADRGRHFYIIGQTGVGKSKAMELMCLSDIFYDQGFAVIDPHGDFAINMLSFIPERRIKDVIYFNPADTAYPIGFNPLEVTDPAFKTQISSELVGVMKRLFDSWGPRLEYILRYTILALLDFPNATILDIPRMLTEKKFRDSVVSYIQDPVVKTFWVTEFASWNDKFATEAVAPVLNKVGAFIANPMIRNIVGQPKSTFNIREIMDSGKILIMNLSRGLVGEDNAAILGAMMVTKIQLAAMSRADIPNIEDRRPFYLYVDEFQNFATDSFAVILSEARKYGLCLTVANQYISQMEQTVRDAVFGNVGSILSFRVSPDDASFLQKYFEPQFMAPDIIQMQNRDFIATMIVEGEKAPAFSARTLAMPKTQHDFTAEIINFSRQTQSRSREDVETMIRTNAENTPPPKGSDQSISQQPNVQPNTSNSIPKPVDKVTGSQQQSQGGLLGVLGIGGEKKKRKRTRSRRKKKNTDNHTNTEHSLAQNQLPAEAAHPRSNQQNSQIGEKPQNMNESGEIQIRQ